MSGVDGRDICKKLKNHTKTNHIPIIMLSAMRDTGKIAKDAGADGFIIKPFEMDNLLTMVKKYTN